MLPIPFDIVVKISSLFFDKKRQYILLFRFELGVFGDYIQSAHLKEAATTQQIDKLSLLSFFFIFAYLLERGDYVIVNEVNLQTL